MLDSLPVEAIGAELFSALLLHALGTVGDLVRSDHRTDPATRPLIEMNVTVEIGG